LCGFAHQKPGQQKTADPNQEAAVKARRDFVFSGFFPAAHRRALALQPPWDFSVPGWQHWFNSAFLMCLRVQQTVRAWATPVCVINLFDSCHPYSKRTSEGAYFSEQETLAREKSASHAARDEAVHPHKHFLQGPSLSQNDRYACWNPQQCHPEPNFKSHWNNCIVKIGEAQQLRIIVWQLSEP
jgi:hypothetical protein